VALLPKVRWKQGARIDSKSREEDNRPLLSRLQRCFRFDSISSLTVLAITRTTLPSFPPPALSLFQLSFSSSSLSSDTTATTAQIEEMAISSSTDFSV
jgi:hypothetical protein